MNLLSLLPQLVPEAIAWAQRQSQQILDSGIALSEQELSLARKVGVQSPEKVRIQYVAALPLPDAPTLRQAAIHLNFHAMAGLTLGHGIYLVRDRSDATLVCHELRHVQQYEYLGGIAAFMPVYLEQIARYDYWDAPLEQDARAHEVMARGT
jgi:hypothetical protein